MTARRLPTQSKLARPGLPDEPHRQSVRANADSFALRPRPLCTDFLRMHNLLVVFLQRVIGKFSRRHRMRHASYIPSRPILFPFRYIFGLAVHQVIARESVMHLATPAEKRVRSFEEPWTWAHLGAMGSRRRAPIRVKQAGRGRTSFRSGRGAYPGFRYADPYEKVFPKCPQPIPTLASNKGCAV